jgi:hypothetical protein
MQTHRLSLDKRNRESKSQQRVVLESPGLMQQQKPDVLMSKEKQRFNKLEKEEVIPRYKSASPLYYQEDHQNAKFEQKVQNFEPQIHYVVE